MVALPVPLPTETSLSLQSSSSIPYKLQISTSSDPSPLLRLNLTSPTTSLRWYGEFQASYVEDLTRKAGNYKKMSVFLTMLTSKSTTTNIDVLTLSELKSMKQKSSSRSAIPPQMSASADSGRRYVILTYVGEFDKVHYPLPLKVTEDELDSNKTQVDLLRYELNQKDEEIRRLSEDLAAALTKMESTPSSLPPPPPPTSAGNVGDLKRKNASLRRKLTAMESAFLEETKRNKKEIRELKASIASVSEEARGENKIDQLRRKLSSLSSALRKERENHSRTKNGATIKLTRLREELERVKAENESLQRGRKADRVKKERVGRSTTPRDRRRNGNTSYDRPTSSSRSARSSARTPSTGGSRGSKSSKSQQKRGSRSRSNSSTRSAPRFDPTEYVREKARKEEERRRRRAWENSPARSVDSRSSRGSARSVDSRGSRGSSVGSRGKRAERTARGSKRGSKKATRKPNRNNENLAPPQIKNYARQQSATKQQQQHLSEGEDVQGEIKDINARLQDLQTFINQANGSNK